MIFLGPLFQREQEALILENTPSNTIQNQANAFQWNVIEGLLENGVRDIQIINVLPVGTFPNGYRQIVLKDKNWGDNNKEIGALNLHFLKQYIRYKKIKKLLKKTEEKEILIYSTYLPFLKAVKKLPKDIQIVLIVTDLPEYYDLAKTSVLKAFFRKLNNKKIYKCLERVDKYVLLTEKMKERLPIENKPYAIVEGMLGDIKQATMHNIKDKFIVTYCGTLNFKFGIKNLVEAVVAMKNENIELHLFGNGDAVNYICETARKRSNIVFHGFVSKKEIEEFYEKTNLLVNPRNNGGEYTKYSFPSKTLEYLLSGVPFLGYRLDGVPEEYYNYINVIPEDSVQAFERSIKNIYENYDLHLEKADRGRRFVIEHKNRGCQAKKIINLIGSLE